MMQGKGTLCPPVVLLVLLFSFGPAAGEDLRALPDTIEGSVSPDGMLLAYLLKVADGMLDAREQHIEGIRTPEAIAERQRYVRQTITRSIGGFPERGPLNARIVGYLERDRFRIEKVIFESQPRFHVTGVLFLPREGTPPYPAVLIPCGHDTDGKACDAYQRMGMALACHGIAAFSYDPIGQGERYQLLGSDGKPVIPASTSEHTMAGLQCLLLGTNVAQVRIWDGMRAIDYLQSRPDIDPSRIGCTGNSGGGTLTAYISALDPRVKVSAPSCYITSFRRLFATILPQDAEQNFTGSIRDGIDHADFLESFAPKPLLVCAASRDFFDIDGTWDTFREAKRFYGRMGLPERIDIIEAEDSHGFSRPRRVAALRWFLRWLKGSADEAAEPDLTPAGVDDLRCTEDGNVLRSLGGRSVFDINAEMGQGLVSERGRMWRELPRPEWLERVRMLAGVEPASGDLAVASRGEIDRGAYRIEKISYRSEPGIVVPALVFVGKEPSRGRRAAVVYVHGGGKAADADPGGPIEKLVTAGFIVLAVDPRGVGETARKGPARGDIARRFGKDWNLSFLAFHVGKTQVGMRAADVLRGVDYLAGRGDVHPARIAAVGIGEAGPIAFHAAALDPRLRALILDHSLVSYDAVVRTPLSAEQLASVVPGALRHYDLPLLAAAVAPRPLRIMTPVDPVGNPVTREAAAAEYAVARDAHGTRGASLVDFPDPEDPERYTRALAEIFPCAGIGVRRRM